MADDPNELKFDHDDSDVTEISCRAERGSILFNGRQGFDADSDDKLIWMYRMKSDNKHCGREIS